MAKNPITLRAVRESLEKQGDLPIFSASVNRISLLSANPDSDAMQLSMEVMKDANLSVKLLRLVNSPYYNRSGGKIGAISQAVMLLGFDTVKNVCLTLKLLDSFSGHDDELDINTMLVHAYLSAGFMREMALRSGINNAEQSYMCGLLHNLGEIIVAYTLPIKYLEIVREAQDRGKEWGRAQQDVIGTTFAEVAVDLAAQWEFPAAITSTMGGKIPDANGPAVTRDTFNQVMASYASLIMGSLYLKQRRTTKSFAQLLAEAARLSGVELDTVKKSLSKAFTMGCDLAEEFNLDKKLLAPRVINSGDEARDRVAKQFAYQAHSSGQPSGSEGGQENSGTSSDQAGNQKFLIDSLGALTLLVSQRADLNTIFLKMMEAAHTGIGFSRVVLFLLNVERARYSGRIAMGANSEVLKLYLSSAVEPRKDLFSQVIMQGKDCLVTDVDDHRWRAFLRPDFREKTGASGFAAAAFGRPGQPLGMVYADMGGLEPRITNEQYDNFTRLVALARLALHMQ